MRRNVHRIWETIRSERRNELSEADNYLAEILLDHEEYREHFENSELLDGREYAAGAAFNPFLHISTHRMVEDQLLACSPAETGLFLEAMEAKGFSRHEAIHLIIMILLQVMHLSTSGHRPFDAARYTRLLAKCKVVDPSEIEQVIEEDLARHPLCQGLH